MKAKASLLYIALFLLFGFLFFNPFFLSGKLPIPSDTIIGLYHPFRDLYAAQYPRGIPFHNYQITDPVRQQYPWKVLSIDSLKQAELPLWNPYNFAGTPLLANVQSAVFYPLNILFFIFPYQFAWSLLIISQPLLAGLFMFLFLQNFRLSKGSSLFGAVSFAFCGFFVSWMEWGNVVSTGLWLPLILLSIDKLESRIKNHELREKRNLWFIMLLFSLTFSFFAGHLQVFFYSVVVAIGYFLARWLQHGRSKKSFLLFMLLASCFIILTFVQWFPTLQFILQSARGIDQDWHKLGWFIPFENLTQFVSPDFFGNPSTLNYWGVWNYGEFIGYVGLLPLLFALYAMVFSRRKIVWFFMFIFLASLLFALPTIFAKVPFKFEFPFLSTSQPTRLLFLSDFALSILAAFGLEYFLQKKKMIFVPLGILAVVIGVFWGYVLFNSFFPAAMQTNVENLVVTQNNLKLPVSLFIVTVLIILFYFIFEKRMKYIKLIFVVLVLLITIGDLYRFSTKYLTFAEEKYLFPQTRALSFLQKQSGQFRVISTDSRVFPPNFSAMYHLQTPDGYDPLFTERYAEFSAAISRGKPDIGQPFGFNRIITIQGYQSTYINLLNIKYILSIGPLDYRFFKEVFVEGDTYVYENKRVMPRTFFVNRVLLADGKYDAIDKLFRIEHGLSETAVVEGLSDDVGKKLANIQPSTADIVDYKANTVVIQTENTGEKFLVLSDASYPTWHAKICDQNSNQCHETTIYLTNYVFRGVIVPSGKHSVIFYNSLL